MARKLLKLGRKITELDREFADWLYTVTTIDTFSGVGYKGLTYEGKRKPRPYHTTYALNNFRREWLKTPITLFALHRDAKSPAFYYCDYRRGRIDLNIDCDNKFGLTLEEFREEVNLLLILLDMEEAYVQISTNGNGFHCYISLETSVENDVLELKRLILDFQKYCRQVVVDNDLKIHVDILGLPAVYDADGKIIKRGTWIKVPYYMEVAEERLAFESRPVYSQRFLLSIVDNVEKKPAVKQKETSGSISSTAKWDLETDICKWFVKHFGSNSYVLSGRRDKITAKEFAQYVLAIELTSRRCAKSTYTHAEWIDTLPEKAVSAVFAEISDAESNVFNKKKYVYIRQLLENYNLINIIDKTYRPTVYGPNGEVLRLGVAAKWRVDSEALGKFFTNKTHRIYGGNIVPVKSGTFFRLSTFFAVVLPSGYEEFCIDPEEYGLSG